MNGAGCVTRKRITEVVNVASIPLRSPFRYPGGKTWLVPHVRQWLRSMDERPARLIEPFAGGGIVGLTAAFENLVDEVVLVELDEDVASVWETVLNGGGEWLAQRIVDFDLSPTSLERAIRASSRSTRFRAFATILRNRVNRGGILAEGAGKMKRGENGKGLASRWYPETLAKRIRAIAEHKDKIRFVHGDGLDLMERSIASWETAYFIDPPYTVAGRRLYQHSEINHEALFALAGLARGPFLITYDQTDDIAALAFRHQLEIAEVAMKTTHHSQKLELFISRDLSWLGQPSLCL